MILMLKYALLSATVLMMVALGGCFSEHSGVINLALEGIMVIGGLVGTMALNLLPADMANVWKVTISICLSAAAGVLYSSLLAFSAIFISHISTGGGFMNASLFPPEIADIISGIIIYLCAFSLLFKNLIVTLFTGKHKKRAAKAPDTEKSNRKEAQ